MTNETPPQMAVTVERLEQAKDCIWLLAQRVYGLGLAGDPVDPAWARQAIDSALHGLQALAEPATGGGLREALKPWADHHGPLPDYDHPAACVFDSGVQYAVELLAKTLDVTGWTPCDGTEEYDGDLAGTLMNIVLAAMPADEHGDRIWPKDIPALLSATASNPPAPSDGVLREQVAHIVMQYLPEYSRVENAKLAADAILALTNPAGEGGVRARALEDAARVAETFPVREPGPLLPRQIELMQEHAEEIASAIRALVADGGEAG